MQYNTIKIVPEFFWFWVKFIILYIEEGIQYKCC